ncbi:hypothetical protein T484DRAFT_1805951 [Baffinella frigidus]|nr:hypothetical protein T484DRAFT_1805951 [Cryptophyta sp. CCMP2293]
MTQRWVLFVALATAAECFPPLLPCLPRAARSNAAALYSRSMERPLRARAQLRMEAGEGLDLGRKSPLFDEQLNLLYDSKCSVCRWEVDTLTSLGATGKIIFTDIESTSFDPSSAENGGVSYEAAMASMTAVTRDGEVLVGARLPVIGVIIQKAYQLFATFRTDVTRGKSLEVLFAERQAAADECQECRQRES